MRTRGFYWVRFKGEVWTVVEWFGYEPGLGEFGEALGSEEWIRAEHIVEWGPRIEPPPRPYQQRLYAWFKSCWTPA